MLALTLVVELILYVLIGLFLQKRHMVGENFDRQLSVIYTDVFLPCLIFDSFQLSFDPSDLRNCAILLVLSVAYFLISALMGQIAFRLLKGDFGRIVRFGLIFTNFTLMGFPIVETLFGSHTLFYFVVFLIPLRFVFYTAPKTMLTEGTHLSLAQKLKAFLTPPMVAVFVGLLFYLCQWHPPQALADVVAGFHAAATPVGMLTCGLVLGKRPLKRLLRWQYLLVSLLRLLVLPALFYVVLLPLPVTQEIRQIIVLCAALPVASLTASFTLRYNPSLDAQFDSAGTVLISHLLSIATIPLWAMLLA